MPNQQIIGSIIQEAPAMLAGGQANILEARIAGFPADVVEQTPWLLYYLGVCKSQYNLAEARANFERAFTLFLSGKDTAGTVLSWCGIVDSIAYEWESLHPLDKWVKWYDDNLRDTVPAPFPVPEIEARLVSAMANAITFRLSAHPDADKWIKRAYEVLENEGGEVNQRIMLGTNMMIYHSLGREAYRTVPLIAYLKKLSLLPGVSPMGRFMSILAEAQFNWPIAAHGQACMDAVNEGLKLSDSTGIHFFDHILFAQGVHGALTAGDLALAEDYLNRFNAVLGGISRIKTSDYYYLAAWLDFLKGDMQGALRHSKNALALIKELGAPVPESLIRIGFAHALFETGQENEADSQIERAIKTAHENKSDGIESMGMLFKAHFMYKKGDTAEGIEVLAVALPMLRKSGHLNFPYWIPSMMAGLCVRALNAGIETELAKHLITKRGLVPDTPPYHCENWPWQIKIKALGKLKVFRDDKALRLTGKALGKPVGMLEAILSLGGRDVKADAVMDMLWPDSEGDNAHKAFDTTLHRLRKFLGGNDTVVLKDGKVGLNELICYLDIWAVEHLMENAEEELRRGKAEGCEREICCVLDKALALYKGPFLGGAKMPQSFDRVQNRLFRLAEWVGGNYEKTERILEAIEFYRRIVETDVSPEEFYRRLMACYRRLGRNSEVLATYKRCREALFSSFDIEPSRETEAIYKSVLASANKPSLPVSNN